MPRVKPLLAEKQIEYDLKLLTEQMISDMAVRGIKKQDVARLSGISPSALSQQLANRRISMTTYLAWQRLKGEKNEKKG